MTTANAVYLDTETTGLSPLYDAVLEIAITDDDGSVLVDSLVNPGPRLAGWPQAEAVHGISQAMVAQAPALTDLAPAIRAAVSDRDVVIYNAAFDKGFIGDLLTGARSVQCAMKAWTAHTGRRQQLTRIARSLYFSWPGEAHRARSDTLACRAVWQYLHIPGERARVDGITRARMVAVEAEIMLARDLRQAREQDARQSRLMTGFWQRWWLRRPLTAHWATTLPVAAAADAFSELFFGKPVALLALEDAVSTHYTRRADIPAHLHAISWFPKERWIAEALTACAAWIGKKNGWLLYDETELARLKQQYPLRFITPQLHHGEILMTRSALAQSGLSATEIAALTPITEQQSGLNGEWYPLYLITRTS